MWRPEVDPQILLFAMNQSEESHSIAIMHVGTLVSSQLIY